MSNLITEIGEALWGDRWQSDMARALGVHKDTVQDWRQERAEPRPGVFIDLSRIVDERIDRLGGLRSQLRDRR